MRFDFSTIKLELEEEQEDNLIIVRLGKTGSGKTLIQTELDVLPRLLEGQEIYCCYWLNWDLNKFPNLHFFAPRDFNSIKDVRNAVFVFDEVARSFPARAYADETSDFLDFVQLHRHRHNTIIANTQDISQVAKTIGVQAHQWSQVQKLSSSYFIRFFRKVFEIPDKLIFQEDFLTYAELKRLAMGFEDNSFSEEDLQPDWQLHRFTKQDLLHPELDIYKQEIVHRFCPRCRSRQGEQILKADTLKFCSPIYNSKGVLVDYSLKKVEYCPKHKNTKLKVRFSSMFDTDYEPVSSGETFKIVKYRVCDKCGKDHIVK